MNNCKGNVAVLWQLPKVFELFRETDFGDFDGVESIMVGLRVLAIFLHRLPEQVVLTYEVTSSLCVRTTGEGHLLNFKLFW